MSLLTTLRRLVRRTGFDVIRYTPRSSAAARQERLFAHYGINLVLDVGACEGAYGRDLRQDGYAGRIVSFEPLQEAFARLEARAGPDPAWSALHVALGAEASTQTMHVAENLESSSLLDMLPRHAEAYPHARYTAEETVTVQPLDAVFDEFYRPGDVAYLKIDTQGYERFVLDGARHSLGRITGVQVEMSLVPLYDGEARLPDMVRYLEDRGFALMSLDAVIDDPVTGQLLQVDGLFFRP